ncbi:hypothetical protein [Intestinibacter sp.]|uniref:hypothetical protein n=1 Tax=Intestinibacter sp. TaxID=1965304 RepID=UPI002A75C131|nr:hypothetical protein [Intestinibacter sp.]MDY2736928.1 hypothetical protein [Intestinibacter sp.]
MTYKELFESLKNGAKWDIGVSINRTNPLPLDQYSIFASLNDLNTYVQSNAVAYPGQIVAVLATGGTEEEPTYTAEAYIIKSVGAGGVVMKLASTTGSGDVSQDIANLQGELNALKARVSVLETEMPKKLNKNELITAAAVWSLVKYDEKGLVTAGEALTANADFIEVKNKANANATEIAKLKEQVTGGVHWIGQATVDKTDPTFPAIEGYTIPKAGDIVARNGIEYIYNGTAWEEFGNEGAHLTLDQVNSAIDTKIQALDVAQINVGANKTISYIKEENGKIAAVPVDIQIAQSQVTGLEDALNGKQAADTDLTKIAAASKDEAKGFLNRAVAENGEVTYVYKDALNEEQVKAVKVNNAAHADAADHVDHQLSIKVGNGDVKVYDGSAPVEVIVPEPEAYVLPAATSEELGGIKIGFQKNGQQVPVELDGNHRAYVTLDEKPGAVADGGLEKVGNDFQIKDGGITTAKIAAGAVTNEKITSMEANKLTQGVGDYLILNCGDSTATFTVDQTEY